MSITVILNGYRRPENLSRQVEAILNQTIKPDQIWLWVNRHADYADFDWNHLQIDRIVRNDYNWKFFGRFALGLMAETEYVAFFDDDTIPGPKWLEHCMSHVHLGGILGAVGATLTNYGYQGEQRTGVGWPECHNDTTQQVDLVGHAWFLRKEWLKYMWQEEPLTYETCEDVHLSYTAQKFGGIKTYVPPQPLDNKEVWGSVQFRLGLDKASSYDIPYKGKLTHYLRVRDYTVRELINKGWKTVRNIKKPEDWDRLHNGGVE
jgi:hypothetical protein